MRALILNSNKKITLEKISKPSRIINPNLIKIKVSYSPINPSDLGFIGNVYGRKKHKSYPLGLGFEGSGIIEESLDSNLIGKRVAFVTNYENEKYVYIT